jgi:hypothetical protein
MPENNKIKCPKCGESFEPSEAYRHQMEEEVIVNLNKKHKEELEQVKKEVAKKAQEQLLKDLKDKEGQISELTERAEKAESEELKIRKEKRELQEAKEKFELEKERQLDKERDKIRASAVQDIQEKDRFKFAEYEKKISDMSKALEEAKRKGSQGSQQLQGEVLEEDVENLLREAFPNDEIIPIGKGQRGGDIIQKVKGKTGRTAGLILWETKRAVWQKTWLSKLREDARKEEASVSVLLSVNLPKDVTDFKLIEGVIVCSYKFALPLATILRRSVFHIAFAKQTAENKDENLEMLYEYLQSEAFRHRFEAFAEGIVNMESDLDYERRAMERVWKKREGQINKMKINAARMYGELQGVVGNALPDIKTFSLPQGEEKVV